MTRTVLEIKDVRHSYGRQSVLNEVSLTVEEGQIACLLGASGCGKTTLLRTIAGFEKISAGMIAIAGKLVSSKDRFHPPETRKIGIVFQDYALFPHLTVFENVAFGIRRLPQVEIDDKVRSLLHSVSLEDIADRYPGEISGGQQQRVALIRALAPEPDLLLLDEPFSNLDHNLRERMKHELKVLLNNFGVTAVMVTHNQDEAFDIADRIGVMENGKIIQWDSAYTLYHEPANHFIAGFLGYSSFLPAELSAAGTLTTELGQVVVDDSRCGLVDRHLSLLIRPDDVIADQSAPCQAIVERIAFRGMYQVYFLKLPSGAEIQCFTSSHDLRFEIGEPMGLRLDVKHAVIFDGEKTLVKHARGPRPDDGLI